MISVVIPTFNRSGMLPRAIESALAQDIETPFELLVVDDGSTDDTARVAAAYAGRGVEYLRNDRGRGGCGARNCGILRSTGRYIALLDDDDVWLPQKLSRQMDAIGEQAGVVCGFFRGSERSVCVKKADRVTLSGMQRSSHPTSGFLMRSEVLRANLFDEELSNAQDWDLLLRIIGRHYVGYVGEPLFVLGMGEHARISTATKELDLDQIGARVAAFEKHRSTIGEYWFGYQVASVVLSHLRQRRNRSRWIAEAVRRCGLLPTAHLLAVRARDLVLRSWE